jgi:hypothetical protein
MFRRCSSYAPRRLRSRGALAHAYAGPSVTTTSPSLRPDSITEIKAAEGLQIPIPNPART